MNVLETAFWALKALKKTATGGGQQSAAPVEESQTEFISRTADPSAAIPHTNKALILERRGDKAGAMACYREAIKAVPQYFDAHAGLTRLLCEAEQWDEAIKHGEIAVRLKRNCPKVHNNISVAWYHKREVAKALKHLSIAVRLTPEDSDLIENLVAIRKAHPELENTPFIIEAKENWKFIAEQWYEEGLNLLSEGKTVEGVAAWRRTVLLMPEWPDALCNLAGILASHPDEKIRSPKEALDLAQRAMKLGDKSARFYDVLAAAYANSARFMEARKTLEEILPTLNAKGPLEAAERLSDHLRIYQQNRTLRREIPIYRPKSASDLGSTQFFYKPAK